MKFYRTKQKVMPAIQWKVPEEMAYPANGPDTRPEFIDKVIWSGKDAFVEIPGGVQVLKAGDWIVPTKFDKKYNVFSHEEFKDIFEPVDPSETLK